MEDSDPVEDDRGPVDYKRAMVRELTRRALRRALVRAQGGVA
jgi:carbon-monoxide dehydrogenase medium subunit